MKKFIILFIVFILAFSQLPILEVLAETRDLDDSGINFTVIQDEEDFMLYQMEENRIVYEYEEITVDDVVHTKKYKITGSLRNLIEDSSTTLILSDDRLILSTFDNMNKTTEQTSLDLNNLNVGETGNSVTTFARCSKIWPDGYTGKKEAITGHAYANNYGEKLGISRLGTLDIIVKTPDKKFDEYTRLVDSLVAQEIQLIPFVGGAQALGELTKAIGNGNVTLATLKSVLKKLGKSIPAVGTLVSMVTYFNTNHKANVSRDGLNGKSVRRGFVC
ncbi:hypothetical protein MKY15_05710 [Sporosarcina sp. FSL K6-1540]|uniref:Uncharacterized protein n=1 Tax=Sporosarcina psychrophila TaxID=1476 RepID=A0ABV2K504_SPOPS